MMKNFRNKILHGNVIDKLKELPDESVHCVVTSPPYYGLRAYGTDPQIWMPTTGNSCEHNFLQSNERKSLGGASKKSTLRNIHGKKASENWAKGAGCDHSFKETKDAANLRGFCIYCNAWKGELGLEPTPELYIEHLVMIFSEVRRVLREDGTCWLNLGDSYWGSGNASGHTEQTENYGRKTETYGATKGHTVGKHINYKPKDLLMIPHRVAIALQQDGWYVRSDIVWSKKNPMPESVTDRPSKAHEYIFLLTKSQKYFYDAEAIREDAVRPGEKQIFGGAKALNNKIEEDDPRFRNGHEQWGREHVQIAGRNKRSVWEITTTPYPEAHFAVFPTKLVEPCILAGTSEHGVCADCGKPYERILEKVTLRSTLDNPNKRFRSRATEHQVVPTDQPNLGSVDKIARSESETKFDTENSTAGRLPTYRQGVRKYASKYAEELTGQQLNAFVREQTIVKERDLSRAEAEAEALYPANKEMQQWYINYVHDHGCMRNTRTVGWKKTCRCQTNKILPGIVLDIFFGSGTTGLVARKGNRDFVGIELNEKYIKIAEKRLTEEIEPKLL